MMVYITKTHLLSDGICDKNMMLYDGTYHKDTLLYDGTYHTDTLLYDGTYHTDTLLYDGTYHTDTLLYDGTYHTDTLLYDADCTRPSPCGWRSPGCMALICTCRLCHRSMRRHGSCTSSLLETWVATFPPPLPAPNSFSVMFVSVFQIINYNSTAVTVLLVLPQAHHFLNM